MSLDFVIHNQATLFTFNGLMLLSALLSPHFSIILLVDSFFAYYCGELEKFIWQPDRRKLFYESIIIRNFGEENVIMVI